MAVSVIAQDGGTDTLAESLTVDVAMTIEQVLLHAFAHAFTGILVIGVRLCHGSAEKSDGKKRDGDGRRCFVGDTHREKWGKKDTLPSSVDDG